MTENRYYTGIDKMRFAAALLVIAIHTSPLDSFSETGNFILTRIFGRVAVPFFFMTSGFFVLSKYRYDGSRLCKFLKKTGIVYAAAVILYLPVNIYSGAFSQSELLPNIIKDIIFDGTLYHLWYLPASMAGIVIADLLIRKLGYGRGFAAAAVLYTIGLFGDSYYGIAEKIPAVEGFYNLIFQVSDYTRNGIFMAPVFMIMGGFISDMRGRVSFPKACTGMILSLVLMFGEAMVLHQNGLQRHDSMYIFLLPCMYFLFSAVLHFRGRQKKALRSVPLIVYIIHPMVIIAVRGVAGLLHMQDFLVHNSLVNYVAVCTISAAAACMLAILWERNGRKQKHNIKTERAYIEINLGNLIYNARTLKKAMPKDCSLMAVVKAEAYGHSAYEIAVCLEKNNIKSFAVATIDEGIRLRKYGISGDILILGYTDVHRAGELKKYRLTQTLIDYEYAGKLNRQGVCIKAHIKIDSGMHRLGFACDDINSIKNAFKMKYLKIEGAFTHLSSCDSLKRDDIDFTQRQIQRFYHAINLLEDCGISVPELHIQSSYGLLNYSGLKCDYVRVGIALYGVLSTPWDKTALQPELRPVMSLKAKIAMTREVAEGEYVGYGRAFRAVCDSKIAVLPIGYADGFPRTLSCGNAGVLIGGRIAPVIGRICMDQLMVDITGIEGVRAGDTAVLIGSSADSFISAPDIAESYGSISNELLARMGARLPVVVKNVK